MSSKVTDSPIRASRTVLSREKSQTECAMHNNADPTTKYAKRPRHKTKSDKYELKEAKHVTGPEEQVHKRRKLKKDHLPGTDFRANNISAERITLEPKRGVGIFSRSKTSLPFMGQDVPDLTFPNMRFLTKGRDAAKRNMNLSHTASDQKKRKNDYSKQLDEFMQRFGNNDSCSLVQKAHPPLDSCHRQVEQNVTTVQGPRNSSHNDGKRDLQVSPSRSV